MKRVIACVVMIFLSGTAWADKQRIGDWILDIEDKYAEAYTSNDSGSVFGFLCVGESCSAYVDARTECDDDAKTTMLVNSEAGATYIVTRCIQFPQGDSVRYVNSFQDEDIVEAMSKGSVISFAIPLRTGEFRVLRFSLTGATDAVIQAVDAIEAKAKASKGKSLFRDSTM